MTTETRLPPRDVVVLCWGTESTSDRRALEIAKFLGAEPTSVVVTPVLLREGASMQRLVPRCTCLIVDAETVARAVDAMPAGIGWLRGLTIDIATHVFVFGLQPTDRHRAIIRALSSDGLLGVEPLSDADATFHVADDHREWCGQFSGLSVGRVDPTREHHFVERTGEQRQDTMIRAGDKPVFVRTVHGGAQIFLSACSELADLDETVRRQAPILAWFSRLIPIMMFLRGALGNRVWHNNNPQACFIIDDPSLKNDRYGFLEYGRLLESMRQRKFSTSIAFIPWNYRRSSHDVTTLFSSRNDVPSLCVHGCDHTGGEFADTDIGSLRTKAQMALERMEIHRRLSGVPFDDVMVFPQGVFSAEAITALRASGYLAAVNSDVVPSTQPESLHLRELLDVAITKFDDFPLFGRRYPRDLAEFAFDLFMGKPVLAVEHHGYFRNGYAALESFVERLNGLDERLEWSDLGTICSRACLTRVGADGDVQVRFYTSRFSLTNRGTTTHQYALVRQQAADGPAPSVTLDGREWRAQCEDGYLRVNLSLDSGQTANIRVTLNETDLTSPRWRDSPLHNVQVLIRRHLSEFRDNHVETSRVLSAIVATARN